MTFETDAKKIKNGMAFIIDNMPYVKFGKRAVKLVPYDWVDFESLIKNHGNEISYIFNSSGKALYKKEEN